ncbi:MAG: hypothetical protein RR643_05210 [Anaerorhabdus sp.]|uniref:hypothetical protein n=1 Tax=Anaerorhabdus sp. TaxID=1872524 RepID=UPI002FCAD68D
MTEEIKFVEDITAMQEEIEAERILNKTKKVKKILKWTAIGTVAAVAVIYAGKVLKDNKIIEVVEEVIEEVGE